MKPEQEYASQRLEIRARHFAACWSEDGDRRGTSLHIVGARDFRLPVAPRHPPYEGNSPVLRELERTKDATDRRLTLGAFIAAAGFDSVFSLLVRSTAEGRVESIYHTECADHDWTLRYTAHRYMEIDPRVAHGYHYDLPFVWDIDTLDAAWKDNPDGRCQNMRNDLLTRHMRSGITFGFSGGKGLGRHLLTFSSARESRHWIGDRVVGGAYAIGAVMHALLTERGAYFLAVDAFCGQD